MLSGLSWLGHNVEFAASAKHNWRAIAPTHKSAEHAAPSGGQRRETNFGTL